VYSLGSPALRFLGLNAGTVSSTSIFNSGTVSSTNLVVSGNATLNQTTTTNLFASGTVSTTQLFVNGSSVCLSNGTNCSGAVVGTTTIWGENPTGNTVYLVTSTRDVLMGGNTTNTSGFIFDSSSNGTSTLIIGGATHTNLLVGTSTYGGGLNSRFALSGNDIFAQGMIGSMEGLFSATGVSIGTGTVVLANSTMYKTDAGDFNFKLNNAASNWSFVNGATTTLTMASSGNVGIGISNPTEALSVKGNVSNLLQTGQSLSLVRTVTVGSNPSGVVTQGQYAYVVNGGSNSLSVVNISNPAKSVQVASVAVSSSPSGVAVEGLYAYVSNSGSNNLSVIDISVPTSPVSKGTVSVGAIPSGVAVQGHYAYVSNFGADSLSVVDVSNPTLPVIVGTVTVGVAPSGVAVSGKYAYVSNSGEDTVSIVDISDPSSPSVIGIADAGSGPEGIALSGHFAYVTNGTGDALSVINVSSPSAPTLVATVLVGISPAGLTVSGRYVYVTNEGDASISIVDVASSTLPAVMTTVSVGTSPSSVAVDGRFVYVTNGGSASLSIIDIGGVETNGLIAHSAQVGSLQVIMDAEIANNLSIGGGLSVGFGGIVSRGGLDISGNIENIPRPGQTFQTMSAVDYGLGISDVAVQGRFAYVADASDHRLLVVDISDPRFPVSVGAVGLGANPDRIVVDGHYAYVLDSSSGDLYVANISNPTNPLLVSNLAVDGDGGLSLDGRYLFVTTGGNTFSVLDISNPAQLVVVGTSTIGAGFLSIASQGNYSYSVSTESDSLSVIDVRAPTRPVTVGSVVVGGDLYAVAVSGRFAYVVGATSSLMSVVDISSSTSPFVVGSVSVGAFPVAIRVSGSYAYVANNDGASLSIIDISSSTRPVEIGQVMVTPGALGLAVSGRYAYVASSEEGTLSIIDIGGIETNGLIAHSAALGTLQVLSDAVIVDDLFVGGALTVDGGGILSTGALSVSATNTTSTFLYAVSSTNMEVSRRLTVGMGGIFSRGVLEIYASSTTATSTSIMNAASNTVAVLQIAGGCSNGSNGTDLFLAGNTTDIRKFSVRCDGSVHADGAYSGAGADFAEFFQKNTSTVLLPGEAVAFDVTTGTSSTVILAQNALRARTLGVVTTRAGFLGNAVEGRADDPGYVAVSLHGQVPVKASALHQSIGIGDELMVGADGYAIKARGPGMILGRALESLASGTGTLTLYVNPQWWAGDLLGTDGSGNVLLKESLTVASSTMASVSTALVDSPYFTFLSRAWNESSLTAVHSEFRLFADAINASTSLFTVANASGTSLLTISDMGDMTVNGKLYLSNKSSQLGSTSTYLFVDDTAPGSVMIATNADGFQTSSTYDYAERFPSVDQLEAGELVMIDPIAGTNYLKRTVSVRDTVIGIVSTKPGFLTGAYSTGTYPIALAGRVPTKVTVANGAIQAGDALTVSDIPGVAQKFQGQGSIVGYALQAYSGLEIGLISVFVKTGGAMGSVIAEPVSSSVDRGERLTGLAKILGGQYSVQVYFAASLNAYPLITVTPYGAVEKGYWVSQVTDTGFTIQVSEPVIADTVFSWTVMPALEGDRMSLSDNTSEPFDPLTGQIVQPTAGIIEEPLPEIESPVIEE